MHRDRSSFFVLQKLCLNFYYNMFNDSVLQKRVTAKKSWWLHKKMSKVLEFGCVCLWLIWVKGTWPISTQHQRSIVPRLRTDAIKYHSLYKIFDIVLGRSFPATILFVSELKTVTAPTEQIGGGAKIQSTVCRLCLVTFVIPSSSTPGFLSLCGSCCLECPEEKSKPSCCSGSFTCASVQGPGLLPYVLSTSSCLGNLPCNLHL